MIKHFEGVDSFLKFGNGIEFSWRKYSLEHDPLQVTRKNVN